MLTQIVTEIEQELDWHPNREIVCKKWDKDGLKIVADKETIEIYYAKNYQIARALLVIKSKGDQCFAIEEPAVYESIGYMADCSRNAVLKVETVKQLIRILAMLGYNELQLYMEDTYEVDGEPMFGYLRGRYTKAELRDMDAYAHAYDMELVPCIQTLAHLKQINRWAQYAGLFDCNDILLCGDERVYAFIEHMFSTLAECFTSRKIHLGMDEAHMLGRGNYLTKNGYQDPMKILTAHLNRISAIAEKYAFKPMMWGDMFYRILNQGEYYDDTKDVRFDKDLLTDLPKNVELVYWDYYSTETAHYDKMFTSYEQFENELRFASAVWKISGWVPHNTYGMHTIDAVVPAIQAHKIRRIMTTGWGDDGAECATFAVLPTLAYFSLKAQNKTQEEIESQFQALTGYTLSQFMSVDALHTLISQSPVKQPITLTKNMLYNDLFMGYLDVLFKGNDKELFKQAVAALQASAKGKYEYVFRTLATFGEVMYLKADMGIRIRTAYENKDLSAMQQIIVDMETLQEKLGTFYEQFRTQWYTENKPQGFEVQDIRLGGLQKRIENCRRTLQAYVEGKLDRVPELEEEILDEAICGATASNFNVNTWIVNCTANVLF